MGPPGAGKGTQGTRLADLWNVPHIASGDILRRIIATEDSELARAARVINEGKLIPDAVASAIVFRELEKPEAARGFVLDGYPRGVAQAEALQAFLCRNGGGSLDAVVALTINEATLIQRLGGRLTCTNCGAIFHVVNEPSETGSKCDQCGGELAQRADDHPAQIRTRFALYHAKTEPLLAYYAERRLLRTVDAEGTEEEVFSRVAAAVTEGLTLAGAAGKHLV